MNETLKCPHCNCEVVDEHLFAGEEIDFVQRNTETGAIEVILKVSCPFCEKTIYTTFWLVKLSKKGPKHLEPNNNLANL
jgi:sarcosine oxidase delta subunit